MVRTEIIVGVDGSAAGTIALRWAAAEAGRRDVSLRVLLAHQWRWPGRAVLAAGEALADAQRQAEQVVARAVAEALRIAPRLEVSGAVVPGPPAGALVAAARAAALVVVGDHGRHGGRPGALGSTAQQVSQHACCPVTVVRGSSARRDAPVVVGVDGASTEEHTLGLAFEEAELRGCALVAVRVLPPAAADWPPGLSGPPTLRYDVVGTALELRAELDAAVTRWQEKYPAVPVQRQVVLGDPARVLGSLSGTARLVVVGDLGHGGFEGLLLGSVSRYLTHHAACPVLVARDPTSRR